MKLLITGGCGFLGSNLASDAILRGDEVVLFGDPTKNEPDVEEWAKASQSIGYEIVTRLGPRVPRIYLNEI